MVGSYKLRYKFLGNYQFVTSALQAHAWHRRDNTFIKFILTSPGQFLTHYYADLDHPR